MLFAIVDVFFCFFCFVWLCCGICFCFNCWFVNVFVGQCLLLFGCVCRGCFQFVVVGLYAFVCICVCCCFVNVCCCWFMFGGGVAFVFVVS